MFGCFDMQKQTSRRTCRFVRISQLLGDSLHDGASACDEALAVYLRKLTGSETCQPLQIAGSSTVWCSESRVIDMLEILAIFTPALIRSGLDVVVLDRLGAVAEQDLDRLVASVKQILGSKVLVVALSDDDQILELSSFREVVCNDDYLCIILRDMIGKTSVPAIESIVDKPAQQVVVKHKHSRRKLASAI